MSEILLVYQVRAPVALDVANTVAQYLKERSISSELRSTCDLQGLPTGDLVLVVCFGGDGTVLRVSRWLGGRPVPIVPVKLGRLNFLGELAPSELPEGLEPYLRRDYWLDERAMLSVRTGAEERAVALNDAVLARAGCPRAICAELRVDQAEVTRYRCDGVIVSTATGSTAYSLAAGGPVLAPQLRSIVTTPIAPHLTAVRSLVLPETAHVQLTNCSFVTAILSVDGQSDRPVEPNGTVEITIADAVCCFARRGQRSDFYRRLAAKLARGVTSRSTTPRTP